MIPKLILLLLFLYQINISLQYCRRSATTVSGSHAPYSVCSGSLIFEDNFDHLNLNVWKPENTLSGGGNWEFQWYTNSRQNSYSRNGVLYLKPSLTADEIGEENLSRMTLDLNRRGYHERCTDSRFYGCSRTGTPDNLLNPIRSAKLTTMSSFAFKYGRVEVRAKLPTGDWLWPAVWFMPSKDVYGTWPMSGEIDLIEGRGNEHLISNGVNIGTKQIGSTLHWGPNPENNAYTRTHFDKNSPRGFNKDFRVYQMYWTPDSIEFSVDGQHIGTVRPGRSFWNLGQFASKGLRNPWQNGSKMAPFDQEFYIILNLAVGGTNGYFPDNAQNYPPKPWSNTSPRGPKEFWNARGSWLPTWQLHANNGENAALQIDYVKVWAL